MNVEARIQRLSDMVAGLTTATEQLASELRAVRRERDALLTVVQKLSIRFELERASHDELKDVVRRLTFRQGTETSEGT